MPRRIYLDNAATSWPKPESVYAACDRYLRELGAPAGRSAYREAGEVAEAIAAARLAAARMLRTVDARQIIFTLNCTDALNLALHGTLRQGDHVVTTVVEHNSVLRPLKVLEEQKIIEVTRVACDARGIVSPDDVRAAMQANTRLVALCHVSNVTGAVQPAAEIGRLAKEQGALLLVDAAQSFGHLPFTADEIHADFIAAAGHKGPLGPLGTGLLFIRAGVEEQLASVRQGGTGSFSEDDRQPDRLPDKFESGNLNAAGLFGLGAGLNYLREQGVDTLHARSQKLTGQLISGLQEIDGVTLYGPQSADEQLGVVSITIAGYEPQEVAAMLDAGYRIQVRAGLHCAPLMHQSLGTLASGGTIRFSIGPFNTPDDIATALQAVSEIAASALV